MKYSIILLGLFFLEAINIVRAIFSSLLVFIIVSDNMYHMKKHARDIKLFYGKKVALAKRDVDFFFKSLLAKTRFVLQETFFSY